MLPATLKSSDDWIFFPDCRAFLPTFHTNCPDGSHFALMGSHFAQNSTTNPCSLLSRHKPLLGICTNTKHPNPTQTPPFPCLNLKVGKINYCLGKMDLNWAKCLKNGQNFSWSGQNNNNNEIIRITDNVTIIWCGIIVLVSKQRSKGSRCSFPLTLVQWARNVGFPKQKNEGILS